MKNPYDIIKSRRITEKSRVLENLHRADSNRSLKKCTSPKVVFNVHPKANKTQIAWAVEQIYADKKIKVIAVNTVNIHPKPRRVRGFLGKTAGQRKAIVTLREGCSIDETV
ncbi:MAG TPA: 50S ribosomal protein L23 [Chlamydiales bacterium]|nr:50S ribosomal protein L23 [Chlamydiales bacterium]